MYVTMYARALNGKIKVWQAENFDNWLLIRHGYFNGNLVTHRVPITMSNSHNQLISTIKKKKKEGYKDINDIISLMPKASTIPYEPDIMWLNSNLPDTNLDNNYNLKPMKCKLFQKGKMQYPAIAQPKYNGVRAVLRWEKTIIEDGLFSKIVERAVIRSKSGLEYHFPHITNVLNKSDFIDKGSGIEVAYDGELYVHNTSLNLINSACPLINERGTISKTSNPIIYKNIVFVIFDIATEDLSQHKRIEILENQKFKLTKLVPTLSKYVHSDDEVAKYTLECIANGYEGCVIRNSTEEYKFGSRPMTIMKSKHFQDAEFKIIDVIPKPREPETALFVLRNDTNDNTFECNPMGTYTERKEDLDNKENYIGQMATVKFYERSGVSDVPFHANVVTIRPKHDIDDTDQSAADDYLDYLHSQY